MSEIRYICYPKTEPPPYFTDKVVAVFQEYEAEISTVELQKGLTSDQVLTKLRENLVSLGFEVETNKRRNNKIERPVFFGENGRPTLRYEIDAYHPEWKCGLEIEAGRAVMGNAIYRDLIQALVMVQVNTLILAVPNSYKYLSTARSSVSRDYEKTRAVADALYGHSRLILPYGLIIIGY